MGAPPDLTITVEEHPSDSDQTSLIQSLVAFNRSQAGDEQYEPLAVFGRAADGEIHCGALGYTHWNWLFVSHLWVHESLRGHDLGTRLLGSIEDAARARGCGAVYLDTYSFQARGFYEKRGYTLFGELPDYPPGGKKFFLWKKLV